MDSKDSKQFKSLSIQQQIHSINNIPDPKFISDYLISLLLTNDENNILLAYQLSFELCENSIEKLRSDIISQIQSNSSIDRRISENIIKILTRQIFNNNVLYFIFKNIIIDRNMIAALKMSFDATNANIYYSFILFYYYICAGSGNDSFYRNNVNYFSQARKWQIINTIACVGGIHIGHLNAGLQILQPFLLKSAPPFQRGGGLLALGLVYANYCWNEPALNVIMNTIDSAQLASTFPIRIGGCFSLGLVTFGSQKIEYYDKVFQMLSNDESSEVCEAASYAIGLIMFGCGECEKLKELFEYMNINEQKLNKGIPMAFAFMMYGKKEMSDSICNKFMSLKNNSIYRECVVWIISLAYVGTNSNAAYERLLRFVENNEDEDDVKRAACIGIGFIFCKSPNEVPSKVNLLTKSDNPNIRIGAALALGISCAGTGMVDAISIIEPLLNDSDVFVRQNAMYSMAMILQTQNIPYIEQFKDFLDLFNRVDVDENMAVGMRIAYGILNASGGNVVVSCNSLRGENCALSTAALALFCNHFKSKLLYLMLPLAFHTTAVFGLNKNLEIPVWKMMCKTNVDDDDDLKILENPFKVEMNQLSNINEVDIPLFRPIMTELSPGFVMLKEMPQ